MQKSLVAVNLNILMYNLAISLHSLLKQQFSIVNTAMTDKLFGEPLVPVSDETLFLILKKYRYINLRSNQVFARQIFDDSLNACNSLLKDINYNQLIIINDPNITQMSVLKIEKTYILPTNENFYFEHRFLRCNFIYMFFSDFAAWDCSYLKTSEYIEEFKDFEKRVQNATTNLNLIKIEGLTQEPEEFFVIWNEITCGYFFNTRLETLEENPSDYISRFNKIWPKFSKILDLIELIYQPFVDELANLWLKKGLSLELINRFLYFKDPIFFRFNLFFGYCAANLGKELTRPLFNIDYYLDNYLLPNIRAQIWGTFLNNYPELLSCYNGKNNFIMKGGALSYMLFFSDVGSKQVKFNDNVSLRLNREVTLQKSLDLSLLITNPYRINHYKTLESLNKFFKELLVLHAASQLNLFFGSLGWFDDEDITNEEKKIYLQKLEALWEEYIKENKILEESEFYEILKKIYQV